MLAGQYKINEYINNLTLDNCPRSLMLIGEYGCGKHLCSSLIADKLKLELVDITDSLDHETITSIYLSSTPHVYEIDCSKITIKEQNIILKFLEEPLKNSYIILLAQNTLNILPTISNRCQQWIFAHYDIDVLDSFVCDSNKQYIEYIYSLASTPGQIIDLEGVDILNIFDLAMLICEKIHVASLPNTLTLSNKIAFKQERDKVNFRYLTKALLTILANKITEDETSKSLDMYMSTINYSQKQDIPNIDQKYIFDNYIIDLWSKSRG